MRRILFFTFMGFSVISFAQFNHFVKTDSIMFYNEYIKPGEFNIKTELNLNLNYFDNFPNASNRLCWYYDSSNKKSVMYDKLKHTNCFDNSNYTNRNFDNDLFIGALNFLIFSFQKK